MSVTPRNRDYTTPPDQHSQVFLRGWANDATNTGIGGGLITGLWRPVALDPSGRLLTSIDNISLSGAEINVVDSGIYTDTFTSITGSQTQIPVGVKAWSILVESGYAYVNGTLLNAYVSMAGGALGGGYLSTTTINVGTTGTAADPSRVVISYET